MLDEAPALEVVEKSSQEMDFVVFGIRGSIGRKMNPVQHGGLVELADIREAHGGDVPVETSSGIGVGVAGKAESHFEREEILKESAPSTLRTAIRRRGGWHSYL
jgi:hypothetical protein